MTDAGLGFLKGMGHRQGAWSLASELVGTELAAWFGLETLEFSVITVAPENELPMYGTAGNVHPGAAFISKKIQGAALDGNDVFLSRLTRPGDVARLVVFDTWIMNGDRCAPPGSLTPPNRDNVMFSPRGRRRYSLVAFDHTHCFAEGDLWDEVSNPALVETDGIYGLFPEFQPYIKREFVLEAVRRLDRLDRETVETIVNAVPKAWGITTGTANAWIDLIHRRARFVVEVVPNLLLAQQELRV